MPDQYEETFHTWDKFAAWYEEKFMNFELYNETYDYLLNNINKPNPKLLELGCGPGNISKYLLSKQSDIDLFGIDVAPAMIALAQKHNPNAHFDVMDVRHINLLTTKYDAIVCGFCVPYLSQSDNEKLLKDCNQLLHSNGLLYLSFVEGDYANSGYQTSNNRDKIYFYFHSEAYLKSILDKQNINLLKIFHFEYKRNESEVELHTVMIGRKSEG